MAQVAPPRLSAPMPGSATVNGDAKARIADELGSARERTLELLAPLADEQLTRQVSPIMSPLVWDLAHIGHFEELWISRRVGGGEPLHSEGDDMYDAFAHTRDERPELPLLDPPAARTYLSDVRARSLEVLGNVELDPSEPLLRDGFVFGLVIQHERQHVETMLQTIQLGGFQHVGGGPPQLFPTEEDEAAFVEAGTFIMGADDEPWAYDNERPAHEVELGAFWIDRLPVSNNEYAMFLAETGRSEPPLTWKREGPAWMCTRFGETIQVQAFEPVQHVSYDEAAAYAAWAGKRLPTEAEWEKAAKLGVLDGVGSVWEWTSSDFSAYPGFDAFPYREYSEVFFGPDYKVLRGGSWATHPTVARVTVRNWDFPVRRQIFAGFRCARDA
jgi:iron(II)-dependent oxidoreductase